MVKNYVFSANSGEVWRWFGNGRLLMRGGECANYVKKSYKICALCENKVAK